MAVCETLWPDGDWQQEFAVPGLDPLHPERRPHRYDVASSVYRVVLENHSPLHDDEDHVYFREDRLRDDMLKQQAVDVGGKLEGWSYAVVRWSEEEIATVLQRDANQAKALIDDLRNSLGRQRHTPSATPLQVPARPLPSASELCRAHSDLRRHVAALEKTTLTYLNEQIWTGRNRTYSYRCTGCGYEDEMGVRAVEERQNPCQSCGERQTWNGFVHACNRAGYPVRDPSVLVDTSAIVELQCLHHSKLIQLQRSRVAEKLRSEPKGLCPTCRKELPRKIHRRPSDMATWYRFVEEMKRHGWTVPLQDWRGTSVTGGGVEQYLIICEGCAGEKKVGIHQALQKAKKSYGCKACQAGQRQKDFAVLAAGYGLVIAPNQIVASTTSSVQLLCDRNGCDRGGAYDVSFDNLRRKGPACKKCRSTTEAKHQSSAS